MGESVEDPRCSRPNIAAWAALVLGAAADVLLLGVLNEWFLPQAGWQEAVVIGALSAIATGCAVAGMRANVSPIVSWIALVVSVPTLLFLTLFGVGQLFGGSY